jgi:hypothetical protein
MRAFLPSCFIIAAILIFGVSCSDKCYECTRKCFTCNKGAVIYSGCEGDSFYIAQSATITSSVESWKSYLETDSFICVNDDIVDEYNICGKSDKKIYEDNNFSCKEK